MQNYIKFLSTLNRRQKIALQLYIDASLLIVSFMGAMLLELEELNSVAQPAIWVTVLFSVAVALLAFWSMGLYQAIVRSITGKILLVVGKGAVLASLSVYIVGFIFGAGLHLSLTIIFGMFSFFSIGGLRFLASAYLRNPNRLNKQPVIIYGAGSAGLQLLNILFYGLEFTPIAMVDDDPSLHHLNVGGVRVYSPDKIPSLIEKTGAKVILLAMPSLARLRRHKIVKSLEDLQLKIKTVPSLPDIINGKAKISELRTVSAEDLLGRHPVTPDPDLLSKNITGRVVMVSGAGGSIGSELCRQILNQHASDLILYDISEYGLYAIEAELNDTAKRLQCKTRIVPVLGSVQHSQKLEATIEAYKVHTIYHAAAYKHVPLIEVNAIEGIRNNVFGTLAITRAAQKFRVANFILVSTDKAVRPTNVMGATKRIAELICQAFAREVPYTTFSMVRFGNVLGSSGSVIPRFQAQIEAGGPVTVTHKDINRYFMTIPEAAQLVIQAGALGAGGDVFVLDMGDPVKIMDLAFSMVKLHGMTPYIVDDLDRMQPNKGDIPVYITGLRKGEKLYEELLIGNDPEPTKHSRIMTASEASLPNDMLMGVLERLQKACEIFDLPMIVDILHELPLDYAPLKADISDSFRGVDLDTEE